MSLLSFNIPLMLTLIRLVVSPLLVPLLFTFLLPIGNFYSNSLLAFVFALLSLTDFFDGYLARRYRKETVLGRLLDPIADKFLVYSTLIALVYVHKLYFYWAVLFIGREFFIMGLREVSASYGFELQVISSAKLKTCMQMVSIIYVIMNPYQHLGIQAPLWNSIEFLLLGIALYLSIVSALDYYLSFIKNIRNHNDFS
jgi:CDP-diacylglycerol--glycerol-3-phosphate 3-phosphatidyltransferase